MTERSHGGRREGAGRPRFSEHELMERATISLPSSYMEGIHQYGEGNLSAGIRRLWEEAYLCKAWELLGIPRELWTAWWLSSDECKDQPCPQCGATAYGPGGDTEYSHAMACPSCGWKITEP